jgi:hypothetical protein
MIIQSILSNWICNPHFLPNLDENNPQSLVSSSFSSSLNVMGFPVPRRIVGAKLAWRGDALGGSIFLVLVGIDIWFALSSPSLSLASCIQDAVLQDSHLLSVATSRGFWSCTPYRLVLLQVHVGDGGTEERVVDGFLVEASVGWYREDMINIDLR